MRNGLHRPLDGAEDDAEIAHLNERHRYNCPRGSSLTRSQRPNELKQSTAQTMMRPGRVVSHQANPRKVRPSASIKPQDTSGGWMPTPRNDSEDSRMMARPTSRIARTTTELSAFGNTCRSMICNGSTPAMRASVT